MSSSPLEESLENHWPADLRCRHLCLVAVSGGPDSTALIHALADSANRQAETGESSFTGAGRSENPRASRHRLAIAHFNHRTRGQESADDARFVQGLARRLGLTCIAGQSNASPQATRSEASLRGERYGFLVDASRRLGARYLVTAHTRDDLVETVLFRLFRGTSLEGLAGILPFREIGEGLTLARPLLGVTKAQVLAYLNDRRLDFCRDPSNLDADYTRNWIRHELLPAVRERVNPQVDAAISRLADLASEQTEAMQTLIDCWLEDKCRPVGNRVSLHLNAWRSHPLALLRQGLLRLWQINGWPQQGLSYEHLHRLAQAIRTTPESIDLPGNIRFEVLEDEQAMLGPAPQS